VLAIRTAAAATANFDLHGAVLYTSCEPCPLCLASALWARIDRVYFAADRHGAAAAGFDDAVFYDYFNGTRPDLMPVSRRDIPASGAPFEAWRNFTDRVEY
jgi:guanine deaminase